MPHLLPSQERQIYDVIEESPIASHRILISYQPVFNSEDEDPLLVFQSNDAEPRGFFWIRLRASHTYQLTRCPGRTRLEEENEVRSFNAVLPWIAEWLQLLSREVAEAERRAGFSTEPAPDWAISDLPAHYHEIIETIAELQDRAQALQRMAGLLWQTGEPLNALVRDVFRGVGFDAEITAPGATYDVTVPFPSGRLLLEVTGIEGQINKKSKKIAQILSTRQSESRSGDRVGVVVNAHRKVPVRERRGLEVATPEALELLVGLNAIIVTTSQLFSMWKLSLMDPWAARRQVDALFAANAGLVEILDVAS